MELLRHLCVPHSDLERLRVIDERLRLISEENQSDFQVSHLWISSSHYKEYAKIWSSGEMVM